METISVIIITQNEADQIRECLKSVTWADEIIVVDGGSTDNTVALCREYTSHVLENPWPGYARQKQFALDHATRSWVLSIDSDERVSDPLMNEIKDILKNPSPQIDGYYMPRLSTFLGKPIRHGGWYPGYQLRLFRREKTTVRQSRVHEGFLVDGQCGHLKNDLLHYTHHTIEASLSRMNRYSSLEAEDRWESGRGRRVAWLEILTHPLSAFLRQFIHLRGFKDGMHGFILAVVTSMVKMALYLKLWERQQQSK